MLVGCEEGRAQDCIIPIEYDAGLADLGLVLRSEPNLIVGKSGQQLRPDLLIGARL